VSVLLKTIQLNSVDFVNDTLKKEVLLFGHGKIPYLFVTNNKFTPHHIKTNTHMSNKIKTPNHLINQPNQSRRRHLPPPTTHLRRANATLHRPLQRLFRRKKRDPATRGGRNPPQRPGERDLATAVAIFVSGEPKKIRRTQKKFRPA
jgi:hypothetical protein